MSLSVTELVSRKVPLEWFESVAITQAVCNTAMEFSDGADSPIPDYAGLVVTPEGRVVFACQGRNGDPPVPKAAALLKALLPDAVPVPLRLFALTALSSAPDASLQAFSEALAYFERPNRAEGLRAVYERATRARAVEVVLLNPQEDSGRDALAAFAIEGAVVEPAEPPRSEPAPRRVWPQALAVVIVLPLFVGWAGWYWTRSPASAPGTSPPATLPPKGVASRASRPPAPVAASAVAPVPEFVPPATAVASRAARLGTRAPAVPTAPVPSRKQSAAGNGVSAALPLSAGRSSPPTRTAVATLVSSASPGTSTGNLGRAGLVADEVVYATVCAPSNPALPEPGIVVYTPADKAVAPPVPVRPWFWTTPPPGADAQDLVNIEVVVSGSGDAVSARVVAGARGYIDGMLLSAVKGGKFQPATRDGCPVAYRQRIWVRAR